MPPNFFPAYSVFLMIMLIPVPRVVCGYNQQFVSCGAQYECGNMDISYPFWGGSRPPYCGHPGFELTCDDINNSSHTLTVARADYWDSYCHPTYVNTTLNESIFSYNATYTDVTLYYDCPQLTSTSTQFNCTNITGYYTTLDLDLGVSIGSCGVYVTIPIFQSAAFAIVSGGGRPTLLTEALKGGFGLERNASNSLCTECVESGEQCGYTSNQFTCYCRNGYSPSTCQNKTSPSGIWKKFIGLFTGVAGVIIILALLFGFRRKCSSGTKFGFKKPRNDDQNVEEFIRRYGSLAPKRYNYSDIKKMTNSLAYKLGKEDLAVYIKENYLMALKGNGEEFLNEVASISRTSHVNIVTLIGFCYDGAKRALIYEFMPNGSLDKFISDTDLQLEWKTMYQIAVGIGRGLEYLHRGCHTRILHFDIKPHNILLDEDFCPKIADFGLAKLCQRKESMVSLTHARGTAGYIAPEVFCRNFGGVSHKSDVYSYGMLVLEMVGGRKNRGAACTSDTYFPDWIYKHLEHGEDLILGRVVNQEEEETVRKMILVSLWCIQTNPTDRPSIHKVVEMLEGSLQSLETPPKPFLFSPTKSPQESSSTSLSAP
ncbi:hypothetical protein PVL29_018715 [Vitis rotundifolia]|uniref:non-specific serine/threonine protein kinase n=1 Tax=Vitis rotundifolia TaxID=103349 RepID=A0AA38Z6B0_VITRO|nr:hypothetical protein PVL29_018715 [Vitis rotundifolia]